MAKTTNNLKGCVEYALTMRFGSAVILGSQRELRIIAHYEREREKGMGLSTAVEKVIHDLRGEKCHEGTMVGSRIGKNWSPQKTEQANVPRGKWAE